MASDVHAGVGTIAVCGAGIMGRGIAQVAALGVILILFALIVVGTVRLALARVGEVGSAT